MEVILEYIEQLQNQVPKGNTWWSLIHSKLHTVYFSFEFRITNLTTFIFNSTTGIEFHALVTSKGLCKNRNPGSGILDLKS